MKKFFSLLLLLGILSQAKAIRIEYGKDIVISRPVYDNLYIAGGTVTVNAPVYGDLVIAGGNITINDTVAKEILLAGGTVYIKGYTGDDIRCAGGELHILNHVGGDLVITGGKVKVGKNAVVNGALLIGGGSTTVDGIIRGMVRSTAGEFVFNGTAETTLDTRAGKIDMNGTVNGSSVMAARQITIGNNARFNGDVRYWNRKGSLDFKQTLNNANATFDPSLKMQDRQWYFLGFSSLLLLIWYVGTAFLMIALIQYFFTSIMQKAAVTAFDSSLKSLGSGLLFIIGAPLLIALLFITLIGVPVALMLLFGYMAVLLLATVITSVVIANWLNRRYHYHWNHWKLVLTALLTFVLLKLFTLTPIIGWLIMFLLVCWAFGSILLNVHLKRKASHMAILP